MKNKAVAKTTAILILSVVIAVAGIGLGVYYATLPRRAAPVKETIVIWSFPLGEESEHKEQLKKMKDLFESKNPNIVLEFEVYPWQGRDARMITAAAGGEAPDICYLNTRHIAKLSFLEGLQPVEDILPESYLENAYPSCIEAPSAGGHVWAGVNLMSMPYIWWYNPDIFSECGITPPSGPEDAWTWKEFIDAAKILKEHGYYIAHPSKPSIVCMTRPIFEQAGVDICKGGPPFVTEVMFNNSKGVSAFKFWQDLFYTYEVVHPSMLGAVPEWQPERELFAKGEVAIMMDSGGTLPLYLNRINSDVKAEVLGFLWKEDVGKDHMTGDVVPGYWGVFKQAYTKHPEAIEKVYEWLFTEEAIELWCKWAGVNSPLKTQEGWFEGTETYEVAKMEDILKWLPYGHLEWGNHPAANDMYNIIQANMDAVAHGVMTPEEACLDSAEKCVDAMERSLSL